MASSHFTSHIHRDIRGCNVASTRTGYVVVLTATTSSPRRYGRRRGWYRVQRPVRDGREDRPPRDTPARSGPSELTGPRPPLPPAGEMTFLRRPREWGRLRRMVA